MPRPTQSATNPRNPRLPRGFTLIELMIVVAIIGVLAAIAIPSFQKSVRRSRTTEALVGLRKIYDGSVVYYDRDHTTPDGRIVPAQFPRSIDMTPGPPPAGVKADPGPDDWSDPTWQALDFGVTDPYYYVYQYGSGGTEARAAFTAAALGNLDGDDIRSTFVRGGTIRDGSVRGWGGIYRINPLE